LTTPRRPRRQGVTYGPPTLHGGSEGSPLVGRLIGFVIVIGAVVALLVGALAVIGRGPDAAPATTPTRTPPAVASPSPSATVRPTPTPTRTATPTATPSPTPFAIELVEGPGKITFAKNYTSDFKLIEPHVDFAVGDQIAWRADIGEPVGRVRVDFDIFRVDPVTLAETNVHSGSFVGRNSNSRYYYAKAPVNREVDGPGIYVMRYSVDGETISEGYFRVTE
jgi:hypothetical protein